MEKIIIPPIPGMPKNPEREKLCRRAGILALITIFYNILEGLFSVGFGLAKDHTNHLEISAASS